MAKLLVKNNKKQKGASLLIVLIALTLLLLGAASVSRWSISYTKLVSNTSLKEASRQASDLGLESAYATIAAMTSFDSASAGYYPTDSFDPTDGSSTATSAWASAVSVTAPNQPFTVKYLIQRLCTGTLPVTDASKQCFAKIGDNANYSSKAGQELLTSPSQVEFRVSVLVTESSGTNTMVQSLISK